MDVFDQMSQDNNGGNPKTIYYDTDAYTNNSDNNSDISDGTVIERRSRSRHISRTKQPKDISVVNDDEDDSLDIKIKLLEAENYTLKQRLYDLERKLNEKDEWIETYELEENESVEQKTL